MVMYHIYIILLYEGYYEGIPQTKQWKLCLTDVSLHILHTSPNAYIDGLVQGKHIPSA